MEKAELLHSGQIDSRFLCPKIDNMYHYQSEVDIGRDIVSLRTSLLDDVVILGECSVVSFEVENSDVASMLVLITRLLSPRFPTRVQRFPCQLYGKCE